MAYWRIKQVRRAERSAVSVIPSARESIDMSTLRNSLGRIVNRGKPHLLIAAVLCLVLAAFGVAMATGQEPEAGEPAYSSIEDVQKQFDPNDDPKTIADLKENGDAEIIYVSMDQEDLPEGVPTLEEAGVQTADEYEKYVVRLNAAGDPGHEEPSGDGSREVGK